MAQQDFEPWTEVLSSINNEEVSCVTSSGLNFRSNEDSFVVSLKGLLSIWPIINFCWLKKEDLTIIVSNFSIFCKQPQTTFYSQDDPPSLPQASFSSGRLVVRGPLIQPINSF